MLNASINQTSPLYQTVSEHNAYNVHFALICQAKHNKCSTRSLKSKNPKREKERKRPKATTSSPTLFPIYPIPVPK